MKFRWVVFFLILFGVAHSADSGIKEPHQFSPKECQICHLEVDKNPSKLKPISNSICESCHQKAEENLSHPINISPETSVPSDMPLKDGNLSCITCHFVHPFSVTFKKFTYYLLRRPGKGQTFCSACHRFDENDHIVFENLHMESYQFGDLDSSLDMYTLQCIECHDDKMGTEPGLGVAEKSQHPFSLHFNHPIGVSYVNVSARKPHKFNFAGTLPPNIRFFKGKIGCGTCHNAYKKNSAILVMSNQRSRLCLACHIK